VLPPRHMFIEFLCSCFFSALSATGPYSRWLANGMFWRHCLLMLSLVSVSLTGQADSAAADVAPVTRAVLSVEAASLAMSSWHQTIAASGPIAAWQETNASVVVGGLRILEIYGDVGSSVRRGQLLARLDTSALQIDVTALHADLVQSRALAEQAQANLQRALKIADGGISGQEMLDYRTRAVTSQAQVDASAAKVAAISWQINHADVLAPDEGLISERLATVGSVATAGQQLFRMIRKQRFEWRGQLDALQLAHVAPGQGVLLTLADGSKATARVRSIAPAVNPQNRLATVFADVIADTAISGHLRAGIYAEGLFVLPARPVLTVPSSAVFIRDGHSMVAQLLMRPGSHGTAKVQMRTVRTAQRLAGAVEIVDGLTVPAMVVLQGGSFLADGDTVNVVNTGMVAGRQRSIIQPDSHSPTSRSTP